MLKFNLSNSERVVKISKNVLGKDVSISKLVTYKYLKVLEHEGLLIKGYVTRVENGGISYHSALTMARRLFPQSKYRVEVNEVKPRHFAIALIEKSQFEVSQEEVDYLIEKNKEESAYVGFSEQLTMF